MYKKMRENRQRGSKSSSGGKPFKRKKRRPCLLCQGKTIDYKDIALVRRFVSDRGKILPPRSTGCCAKHQRIVTRVIKKARQAGLIPYTAD